MKICDFATDGKFYAVKLPIRRGLLFSACFVAYIISSNFARYFEWSIAGTSNTLFDLFYIFRERGKLEVASTFVYESF